MPVTINGDGSITGLAVGGLPNGTVDADTLATNAVTSAKLASNSVTSAKVVSGSIIQVVSGQGSGNQASGGCNASTDFTNTSDDDVVDAYMTFTPLLASSTIVIFINSGCSISGGRNEFKIVESVSGTVVGKTGWGNFGGAQSLEGVFLTGVHRPGNTVQRTYQLVANQVGANTRYVHYNAIANMTIMEIKA